MSATTDDTESDRPELVAGDAVELLASEGFAAWLTAQRVSLVFGTPPEKLWLLGVDDEVGHGRLRRGTRNPCRPLRGLRDDVLAVAPPRGLLSRMIVVMAPPTILGRA